MNIKKTAVVFVGGVHGVGKGTLCKRVSDRLGIPHLSAGDLIRQYKRTERTRDKQVHDIQGNQDVLISALLALSLEGCACLLDGHFCLIGADEQIRRVPTATFVQLAPAAVVVLQDNVERIISRLSGRDDKQYCPVLLASLQDSEMRSAKTVCDELMIPLLVSSPEEYENIASFVHTYSEPLSEL